MATEKKQMTPEEKKREKERLALEKAELAENEKRKKERLKRKKKREVKLKKKIKKEKKRIKKEINFPYKILNLAIALFTLLILIFFLFATDMSLVSIVKWTAFLLLTQYLIFGGAMSAYVYMLAEDKKLELKERIKQDVLDQKIEEDVIKQQELQELQDLEKEIKEKRLAETIKLKNQSQKELQASNEVISSELDNQALPETDLDNPSLPEFHEPKEHFDIEINDTTGNFDDSMAENIPKVEDFERMEIDSEDNDDENQDNNAEQKEFIAFEDYPDLEQHNKNDK